MNRCLRLSSRPMALLFCAAMLCLTWGRQPLAVQKPEAELQLAFGVKVALKGSWNEAAFRFQKAVAADGDNPRAFNNLAVARESLGQWEAAREAYEKALALAPKDGRIRQNYDRFMSFYRSSQQPAERKAGNGP